MHISNIFRGITPDPVNNGSRREGQKYVNLCWAQTIVNSLSCVASAPWRKILTTPLFEIAEV